MLSLTKISLSLTIFFTLFATSVFSQDRVNRQKITFSQRSLQMTSAVGWAYDGTSGEWVDYKNVISSDKDFKTKYVTLQGSYMMSQTDQTFLNIQTNSIIFDSITYYILIVEKWDGEYEYPAIQEDWRTFKTKVGYIFTKEEYSKLYSLNGRMSLQAISKVKMGSRYETFSEIGFLDKLQYELINIKKGSIYIDKPNSLLLYITDKNKVRFHLPQQYGHYGWDDDKEYFETTIENFSRIILK